MGLIIDESMKTKIVDVIRKIDTSSVIAVKLDLETGLAITISEYRWDGQNTRQICFCRTRIRLYWSLLI